MSPRIAAAAVFTLAAALYIRTLHPAYPPDDSPETVAASVNLGVQHAPGYPLMTLAGKLATLLPAGSAYFRVNLMAAALGAGAASAVALTVARLFPTPAGAAAGLASGLALAASGLHWDCAISAKGAIYQMNLLFVLLAFLALLRGSTAGGSFFLGMGLANHWMSIAWWLPALFLMGRPWTARKTALSFVSALLGISLYLQLPLSAAREPCWGDPVNLRNTLDILTRRGFMPQAARKPPAMSFLQAGHALLLPVREAGWLFTLAALAGGAALWRGRKRAFAGLASGALLTVAAVSAVTNPVHLTTGELFLWLADRFFLPWLAVLAVASGAGLLLLRAALPPRHRWAALALGALLPLVISVPRFARENHSNDYLGFDYAGNLLVNINRPAVILAEADYQTFPLIALRRVEDRGPELDLVITNPFLNRKWGWKRLASRYPEAAVAMAPETPWETRVGAFADRLASRRTLYHLTLCNYPSLARRLDFHGIMTALRPKEGLKPREATEAEADGYFRRFRMRGMYSDSPHKDETAFSVLDVYTMARTAGGGMKQKNGDLWGAVEIYRRALRIRGRMGRVLVLSSLGQCLGRLQRYAEAEDAFRAAARLKPRDLDLWTNLATACAAQGKSAEAFLLFDYVLQRNPRHGSALANLQALRKRMGY